MAHIPSADHPPVVTAGVSGDTAQMWAEFAGRLRAFLARRVPPGIEPDDVLQEVFVRVIRHLPSLRDTERIESWLFQIARNTLHDAMRARQRRDNRTDPLEEDLPAGSDGEEERAAEAELAPCLTPLIGRLAESYRHAIELTSVQGLTQAEAAARAGLSVSGMKSRVQRAREQLRVMLLRCCDVALDRRQAVTDFQPRGSAPCSASGGESPSSSGCGADPCRATSLRPTRSSGVS